MKSIKFIEQKLDELIIKIPQIRCEYAYDSFDNSHCIKITPKNYYYNNEYIKVEENIVTEFISQFPCEGIVFITEDDLIDIEKRLAKKRNYGKPKKIELMER